MSRRFIEISLIGLILVSFLFTGCNGTSNPSTPQPVAQVTPSSPQVAPSPLNDLEEALRFVRNGQYAYIWVVSRKDGKPLNADDGNFLRKNAPQVVDWVKADAESRKFVGGTNFNLEEGNLEELKKRFVTEDYSAR